MRTFSYAVSVAAGTWVLGACGLKIARAFYERGFGLAPDPQTSLCHLGAAAGLCLILAPVRHSFRSKID